MSECLKDVTNLLNCKNIVSPIELPQMPVSEKDLVTKMGILLTEFNTPTSETLNITNNDKIEIVKIPFGYDDNSNVISPTKLEVNMISSDGKMVGFIPSDDQLFKHDGNVPFTRDMVIPNSEQISLRVVVDENVDHLINNYFGLDPKDYTKSSFDLMAELPDLSKYSKFETDYEELDKLRFRVYIQTKIAYHAIMEKIKDDNIQTDLLEENLIVLNNEELLQASAERNLNIKKLGNRGILSGIDLIKDAIKHFS